MDKRYQVFISSTYRDLVEERLEVQQALLELDCFPAGMELFPAADDDQWTLIRNVIDLSDFYVIIVAARYGSVHADRGLSYTEMEFDYAREKNIPVLAFVHGEPGSVRSDYTDENSDLKEKLEAFRRKVMTGRMVKTYANSADLGSKVSRALTAAIKTTDRPGWVRGDRALTPAMQLETANLRAQLAEARTAAVSGRATGGATEIDFSFAHGSEQFSVGYVVNFSGSGYEPQKGSMELDWDSVFAVIAPAMVTEVPEVDIRKRFNGYLTSEWAPNRKASLQVNNTTWNSIVVQFRALGIITSGARERPIDDRNRYWVLTPAGDQYMTEKLASPSTFAPRSDD